MSNQEWTAAYFTANGKLWIWCTSRLIISSVWNSMNLSERGGASCHFPRRVLFPLWGSSKMHCSKYCDESLMIVALRGCGWYDSRLLYPVIRPSIPASIYTATNAFTIHSDQVFCPKFGSLKQSTRSAIIISNEGQLLSMPIAWHRQWQAYNFKIIVKIVGHLMKLLNNCSSVMGTKDVFASFSCGQF